MTDELTRLSQGKYLSLTTFRRNGDGVATPVWVVRDGAHLYVTTDAGSGKVKRLRNSGRVLLAPCDMRGNVTGDAVPGEARLLDPDESKRVASMVSGRYGLMGKALSLASKLRRGSGSIGIEITPGGVPG
ncbi:MAG: hypothetical protein RLZ55_120 [Actinomycetota bacterium]